MLKKQQVDAPWELNQQQRERETERERKRERERERNKERWFNFYAPQASKFTTTDAIKIVVEEKVSGCARTQSVPSKMCLFYCRSSNRIYLPLSPNCPPNLNR